MKVFTMEKFPTVTIAIPTYNEAIDIERVIKVFLSTQYPNLIEIFVADGGSTDGTQNIIQQLSFIDNRVALIHNPLKIQSAGLNQILHICSGDIFLRADAHSEYAIDYIERCVEALLESKALNVGGAQRFVAKTRFQSGVAIASKSPLGSGGAKYRDAQYSGYAETVYLGCFWRKALLDLKGYSTNATANEDAELNLRLRDYASQFLDISADHTIYISSKIQSWYYPRKTWKSLLIQYFRYGRGRLLTSIRHSDHLQIRGAIPFLGLLLMLLIECLELFFPTPNLPAWNLIVLGIVVAYLESLRVNLKFRKDFRKEIWRGNSKKTPSFLICWFFCGIALLTIPIAHSCGFAYQLFRNKVLGFPDW